MEIQLGYGPSSSPLLFLRPRNLARLLPQKRVFIIVGSQFFNEVLGWDFVPLAFAFAPSSGWRARRCRRLV